jgi:mannosyltransferase
VTIAAQHGAALGSGIAHDGGNMSGYYVLLHVLVGWFGNGTLLVRLPSVLAVVATVALVSGLGLRMGGRPAALASGLLCAVSLPLIFWAQSARGYALMVALVTGSFFVYAALLERVAAGRRAWGAWLGYALCLALAGYCSFVAVLAIPAQLVLLARNRRAAWHAIAAIGAAIVCWIPLVALALRRGSGQLFWVPRPSHTLEKQVFELVTSAGLQPSFKPTAVMALLLIVTLVALLSIGALIVARSVARTGSRVDDRVLLALAWLVVPVGLAWIESLFGPRVFLPRNLLLVVPAVALLLGWGLTLPRMPRVLGWALVAGFVGLRAAALVPSYGVSPEDWRGATAYVLAHAKPGDCLAFYPSDGRMAFQYYIGTRPAAVARAPRSVLPVAAWGEAKPFVEDYATLPASAVSTLPASCPRLWFVSSHEGQPGGPAQSEANYARYLALRAELARAYPHRASARFGYAALIRLELLTDAR